MNEKIIKEFDKLINHIKADNNIDNKDQFRIRNLTIVLSLLKKYPKKITLDNYKELLDVPNIGKGSVDRIKEILENGSLSELANYKENTKDKIINELESIVGIGYAKAVQLYKKGITSVADLKKKVKNKEIKLNEKLMLGLKYYGKFEGNIPRKETDKINEILKSIIDKMDSKYIYEICGSYRRGNKTSGDIDILISKKDKLDKNINDLEIIINLLKLPIPQNNNKPLIIDDLTDKNYKTKYMGFCKYKDNLVRRIDIRFVDYKYWFSSLVYFTGSMMLNKKMRNLAKKENLKLSEYGLTRKNGEKILIKSEKEIFDILGMKYLKPTERNIE